MSLIVEHRLVVALNLGGTVAQTVARGNVMVAGIGSDPTTFPSPTPTLAVVTTSLQTLTSAETTAGTKAKGTAPARNGALKSARNYLRALANYVQAIADQNPELAAEIITKAGLTYRIVTHAPKAVLEARPGSQPGSALIIGRAAPRSSRACYEWQYCTDGKTWLSAPVTTSAKTTISGLPSATLCTFRYRITVKNVPGTWSDPVSLLVH